MCCLGGQDAPSPSPMPESRNLGNLSLARLALPARPLVLRLLFEQSVMCGELALQSGEWAQLQFHSLSYVRRGSSARLPKRKM